MPIAPILMTERLIIRMGGTEDAHAAGDFYRRNWEHLEPWWPKLDIRSLEDEPRKNALLHAQRDFQNGAAVRLMITPRSSPNLMVGLVNINNIVRGVSQCGVLGYGMDHLCEGQGMMTEALIEVKRYAFEELNLHRLEANHLPHNVRSAAVLRNLNFVVSGYARDYLLIAGRWQDHVLTSCTNPNWNPTP